MKKLRRKLGDPAANPTYIFNRHGVGYSFGDPAAAWEAGRTARAAITDRPSFQVQTLSSQALRSRMPGDSSHWVATRGNLPVDP